MGRLPPAADPVGHFYKELVLLQQVRLVVDALTRFGVLVPRLFNVVCVVIGHISVDVGGDPPAVVHDVPIELAKRG